MNIALNLPIKTHWLAMIESGRKREEYRGAGNRQANRLWRRWSNRGIPAATQAAIFRAGYNPTSRAVAVRLDNILLRGNEWKDRRHEWGEPGGPRAYFAILLGGVLASGTYRDVKEKVLSMEGGAE